MYPSSQRARSSDTAGTLYSGPITVSATTTIKAIAYASGLADSAVESATYTIQPPVAAPTFNPAGGMYLTTQTVTISTTTSGASIRYTTDGSTPSETAGTLYTGPITVSASMTIKAIAYESGMTDSAIATVSYVIVLWYNSAWGNRKPITINHNQVSGSSSLTNYPMLFSVTDTALASAANGGGVGKPDGTDILFTAADGTTKLNHEIESYNPVTGQFIAWVQIPTLSNTADTVIYVYYGNASATNQQNPTGVWDSNYQGVYHLGNGTTLNANDSTGNANNGTDYGATAASGEIGGGGSFASAYIDTGDPASLQITSAITLEAWVQFTGAFGSNYPRILSKFTGSTGYELLMAGSSDMTPNRLYLQTGVNGYLQSARADNAITPNTWYHVVGTYDGSTLKLYINGSVQGWQNQLSGAIGSDTSDFNIGRGSFGNGYWTGLIDEVRVSNTARSADWIATEYNNESSPATFYTVGAASGSGVVETPAFNPAGGTYASAQTITISTTTPGASIRYTTDGSTPSETAGTLYSAPVTVTATTSLKAIAYESGLPDSAVATATYTIQPVVAAPTFSPVTGIYNSAQTVTISTTTSGASIRYTTDGSTPSETSGTMYSGPITVNASVTINAIAYETGMTDSTVASASYTIAGMSWYSPYWSDRKSIIIAHSQVSGSSNLTNFPVLISVTDANLATVANGGSVGIADGSDILFTAADGATKLNHEIESYNPGTGQLIAWVQIPTVSPTTDTVIFIYYGNASATTQQNPTGVWDSNYKAVYHLPNGTTLSGNDSTSNGNNGTLANSPAATSGKIDGAASFNGSSTQYIGTPYAGPASQTPFTASFWIATTSTSQPSGKNTAAIMGWGNGGTCGNPGYFVIASVDGLGHGADNTGLQIDSPCVGYQQWPNAIVYDGNWQYVTLACNGSTCSAYRNGALQSGTANQLAVGTGNNVKIAMGDFSDSGPFTGQLDEVRISSIMRSAGWIATEYNNQSSPSTFLSFGSQQGSWEPPPVATPTFSPSAGTYSSAQTVTISTTTSGASIRYTTDGSTPSETTGTLYSGPITVNASVTMNAIAYASGMTDSTVATASYTISSWYNAGWSNRKPITISHGQVSGNSSLTNFPMLFSVTDTTLKSSSNGGGVGKADGTDILFTAADGATKLNHEIESYNPLTGQLIAWVQIPTLSNAIDTVIYMYYGNAAAGDQQNKTGVWDSSYQGVYHLGNGTTLEGSDSTANANNGTVTGATAATGEIGIGASFNGSGNYIDLGNPSSLQITGDAITLSGWIKPTNANASRWERLAVKAMPGNNDPFISYGLYRTDGASTVNMGVATGGAGSLTSVTGGTLSAGIWTYVVGTYDGSNIRLYVNGLPAGSVAKSGNMSGTSRDVILGADTEINSEYFNGVMDELRVSNIARSAGWIATEYRNESSPSTFYTVGTASGPGVVGTPVFSPVAGTYTSVQTVSITTTTPGATIRYTTDGSTPSETAGTLYSGAITVSATETINAIAYASGMTDSAVASASYTIQPPPSVATPTFSPAAGTYASAQSVAISTTTSGASIRYTTDGSTPSETAGTLYSGPITVNASETIKAIAYESGMTDSSIASATYTIQSVVATPTFSPNGGNYTAAQSVSISTTTSGALIRYTTDGSTPTETAGTVYSSPITVSATTTINAIAYASGMTDSAVASATYTIQPVVATPAFSLAAGSYNGAQSVTISSATSGAIIRYTIDGSSPSETRGTVYIGPVSVNRSMTLTAIAYATGMTDSALGTAGYTIVAAAPMITSVSPTTGAPGSTVTISGSGFGSTQGSGSAWLGTTLATVVSWSDSQVVATVALNSTSGTAQVQQGGVWSSNTVPFNVSAPAITSVSPASGLPGAQVTITGSGFGASQNNGQVMLGTAAGVVQSWSDTQVVAQVGTGATSGNAQILQNGVWSNSVAFTVPLPTITAISPTSGASGTSVTFTGSGFGSTQGTGIAWLGGANGTVQSWSDTQVVATVAPSAVSGVARIQQNGAWSNAKTFTVPGGSASLLPSLLNMVVGDTHTIQALGPNGQPVTGLTWTSSDTTVVSLSTDDPPILTALAAGHVTITAGGASADVTVSSVALALGTVLWSNPGDGSGVTSIVPAVPSPNGVADVFAFQNDNTVQAITSDGTTAWSADVSNSLITLPDFNGGLVLSNFAPGQCCQVVSVVSLDGITGQPRSSYAPPSGTNLGGAGEMAVHTDGTIFALQASALNADGFYTVVSVIGIDPSTGAQKFSVPLVTDNPPNSPNPWDGHVDAGLIVAGDGYAYVAYDYGVGNPDGNGFQGYYLNLLRVDSAGDTDTIPIQGVPPPGPNLSVLFPSNLITNADTGVVLSFEVEPVANPEYRVGHAAPRDSSVPPPVYSLAITTGTSVSIVSGPQIPNQNGPIVPVLQDQDGSFVGTVGVGDPNNPTNYMVAFDTSGNVRWTVSNDRPQIATADGGVIGQSGITYDQSGNAIGQSANLPVQSMTGNDYQLGSVELLFLPPILFAPTFAAVQGGSPLGSLTFIPSLGSIYRSQLADIAKGYVGNTSQWAGANYNGQATCNLFVRDCLNQTSNATQLNIPSPVRPNLFWYQLNYRHPFLAADWANESVNGGCWKPLPAGPDGALPGDVIATGGPPDGTGHVGIVVSPNVGAPLYIDASAADVAPYFWTPAQQAGFTPGTITLTDYGFRLPGFDPTNPADVQGLKQDSHVRRFACY